MRITVKSLICDDLGYCCLWAFFRLNKRTALVATRLGVTPRAVCYAKSAAKRGSCENKANCLQHKIR